MRPVADSLGLKECTGPSGQTTFHRVFEVDQRENGRPSQQHEHNKCITSPDGLLL
jgi:hypothetical protein